MGKRRNTKKKQPSRQPRSNAQNETKEARLNGSNAVATETVAYPQADRSFANITLLVNSLGTLVSIGVLIVYALQLREMKSATTAATTSAKAAEGALRVGQSSERAWIATPVVKTDPIIPQIGQLLDAVVNVKNVGNTPALKVGGHIVVEPVPRGSKPNFSYEGDKSFSPGIMQPGTDYFVRIPIILHLTTKEPGPLTPPILANLRANDSTIFIHGRIDYEDVFGRAHWITICYSWITPTLHAFGACDGHNDVDIDNTH